MYKYLFIAEKPSLMQAVQNCYNNHQAEVIAKVGMIDFVALAGHVCGYCKPDVYPNWEGSWDSIEYPMIPNVWQITENADKKKIVDNIKNIARQYSGIIVGTDSDQEGYGIYYLLEQYLHLEDIYALRFVEKSLTDKELLEALLCMTEIHTDPVHIRMTHAFKLRSQADWLYGMNATRMMSVKTGYKARIGRVVAPTVKLVYDNSIAIRDFVPRKYYTVKANYGSFVSTLVDAEGKAQEFEAPCDTSFIPLQGVVTNKESKIEYTHAPQLYDLSSLQAEAGRMFGYTPEQTLDIIQSLYENKYLSYPRTQCRYVTEEKAKEFPMLLQTVRVFENLAPYVDMICSDNAAIERVLNDKDVVNTKEVEKESHDALLPTTCVPNLSEMTEDEKIICELIYRRLVAEFLPKLEEEKTKLDIMHGGFLFKADGKIVKNQGWKVLYTQGKDKVIPPLDINSVITAEEILSPESVTKPPKRLTQSTLLSAMLNIANQIKDPELRKSLADSKGIGTPSSRHTIIKNIIESGYVVDKKGLYITERGINYINNLEGINIVDPTFAATMDTYIKRIQYGTLDFDSVYNNVIENLKEVCQQIEKVKPPEREVVPQHCLKCNNQLYVGQYNYMCMTDGCGFKIPLSAYGKKITKELLTELYTNRQIGPFTDLTYIDKESKKAKKFRAKFLLDVEKGIKPDYSSGLTCPFCSKEVNASAYGYYCDCGLKIYNPYHGKLFTDEDMSELFRNGFLPQSNKYKYKKSVEKNGKISYTGDAYTAKVILTEEKKLVFDFPEKQDAGETFLTNHICPFCNNNVLINNIYYFCNCGLKIKRVSFGIEFDDFLVRQLLTNRTTGTITLYSEKKKRNYESELILTDEKKVSFPPRKKK